MLPLLLIRISPSAPSRRVSPGSVCIHTDRPRGTCGSSLTSCAIRNSHARERAISSMVLVESRSLAGDCRGVRYESSSAADCPFVPIRRRRLLSRRPVSREWSRRAHPPCAGCLVIDGQSETGIAAFSSAIYVISAGRYLSQTEQRVSTHQPMLRLGFPGLSFGASASCLFPITPKNDLLALSAR